MSTANSVKPQSVRTAFAVSALALLPILSWEAMDARSSATLAAPIAHSTAPGAVRHATTISKSDWTWGHRKSDRMAAADRPRRMVVRLVVPAETGAPVVSRPQTEKSDREPVSVIAPVGVPGEFADWLVRNKTTTGGARITDFASRRTNDNRKACRMRHDAIVSAFAIRHARIMADEPVMFQSSICTANGEIVITCFGTSATISPRKVHPGGRCSQPG